MIHLEVKPLVGGTPTAASDPMKKQNMVTGILRPTPPSSEIVSAWVRSMTAPTMRKSRSLKNTWFAMPTATPRTMYPIWLTVDQMNTSLRLFWSMACTALYSSVNAPIHAVAYMTACCEKSPAVSGDCAYTLPKTRNSFTRPKTAIFSSTEEM